MQFSALVLCFSIYIVSITKWSNVQATALHTTPGATGSTDDATGGYVEAGPDRALVQKVCDKMFESTIFFVKIRVGLTGARFLLLETLLLSEKNQLYILPG